MSASPLSFRWRRLIVRARATYRRIVIDSGLPGAARNPLLFTGFVVREVIDKECSTRAMALAYQLLFCLVPAMTLVTAVFAMLPGLEPARDRLVDYLAGELLPSDPELVRVPIEGFMANAEVFSLVGIAVLLYGTGALLATLYGALNAIWSVRPVRATWFQRLGTLGLLGALVLSGGLVSVATSDPFQKLLALADRAPLITPGVRAFATGLAIGWLGLFLIYKLVPSTWIQTGSAAWAALGASIAFSLAKFGFLAYAGWSQTYTQIYGVFGALFLSLLWVWLAWLIVLGGAVTAFVLQNYEYLAGREQRKLIGERYETFYATRLLLEVYRDERAGRTPVSVVELAGRLGLSVHLADRLGDSLAARGLVQQVGSTRADALSPAMPPTDISVARVADAVTDDGFDVPRRPDLDGERPLRDLLIDARRALRDPLRRTTLADLLDTADPG